MTACEDHRLNDVNSVEWCI